VLLSLVGAYYYLRIVKLMYFDAPTDTSPITASRGMQITLSANGIAVVLLGILPGPLMTACLYAISQALAN
jgi:NADH-quinone oxidoreductase subunit N